MTLALPLAPIPALPASGCGYHRIRALDENVESGPRVGVGDRW
jgi:hypothetical protein